MGDARREDARVHAITQPSSAFTVAQPGRNQKTRASKVSGRSNAGPVVNVYVTEVRSSGSAVSSGARGGAWPVLNNLDTVISFAAIILGVSLIFTVPPPPTSTLLHLPARHPA